MRHLGDFAVDDHGVYLPRLKGKRLILGNHDHPRFKHAVGWSTVDHMRAVKVDGDRSGALLAAGVLWSRSGRCLRRCSHSGYRFYRRRLSSRRDCFDDPLLLRRLQVARVCGVNDNLYKGPLSTWAG
jgi:hypothetical protein